MTTLLAVDLGLKTGLAAFGEHGRLLWYRSSNFGSRDRLKRGAWAVLRDVPDLEWVYVEGDRALADVWAKAAEKRGARTRAVSPETWRAALLHERERRTGAKAKEHADRMARAVIDWSAAARPTSLRHDAAEAILIGLYGVLDVGWLSGLPREIR